MNVLVLCSPHPSFANVVVEIQRRRPAGLVIVGLKQPDPLDWVCELRNLDAFNELPIAVGGRDELRKQIQGTAFDGLVATRAVRKTRLPRQVFVDQRARELIVNGRRLMCSPMEFRILIFFLRYPNIVFSREELLRRTSS